MTKGDIPPVDEKIKIICRIRPFLDNEVEEPAVQVEGGNTIALDNKRDPASPHLYKNFSSCYSSAASQDSIFAKDVRPLIERVFEGFDATVFAYGVTGSGKTFTMQGNHQEPGIIPRVAEFLFETKQATQISTIEITMSYMEILKETVYDMLTTKRKNTSLDIREDVNRDVFVANLTEKPIQSYSEFQKFFNKASKNRSTASTKLNARSSRSHAILTFNVTTTTPVETEDGQHNETLMGKINLIDLAGSEDNRKSGNGKARMTESAAINKSLFVLGQVVEALNNGSIRVPYRNSKMTRILQSTLSGSSLGMMIINIAPGHNFFTDTTNTLNFAHRSKEIKSTPKANIRRTRSVTRNLLKDHQTTATTTTTTATLTKIATSTTSINHRSPDREAFLQQRARQTITPADIRNRRLSYSPHQVIKRPLDTYEQRLRTQKRSRHSLSPNEATRYTNTFLSPPSPPTTKQQQRTWSTITVSNQQPSTIPLENTVVRLPRNQPRVDDNGEELIIMTRLEYNNLRDQLMQQARQELLSSMTNRIDQ